MGQLNVLFNVPPVIEQGLTSGALERVGGVIVDSNTRQIVAWLRDSGVAETAVKAVESGLNPMASVMQAASTASTLIDGHMTRQAIASVAQQIQSLSSLMVGGQMLNLTMTAMTFRIILKRLDALSEQINKLGDLVQAEFQRERDMRFKVALQAARDIFESDSPITRQEASRSAIDGLFEAREQFLHDFRDVFEQATSLPHLQLAHHYLQRAFYAEVSRVRCYAASGDLELAKTRLTESVPIFREYAEVLINRWLGEYQAIYFHPEVPTAQLNRFLRVKQWMKGIQSGNNAYALFEIIETARKDFWNTDLISDDYDGILNRVTRRPTLTMDDRIAQLDANLQQAEAVMENFDRLWGLEMEMRTMRLSFEDWTSLVDEEQLEEHGAALIVDEEILERLTL